MERGRLARAAFHARDRADDAGHRSNGSGAAPKAAKCRGTTSRSRRAPHCGGKVIENYRAYACTQCVFSISSIRVALLRDCEVEDLLREKQIGR